ncbi:MAG: DoxX family protein [Heyndrickxia sp.]
MSALASLGVLLIRVILGASFTAHGSQKLFGWFGGHGLAGTGGFFESIGIKPGKTMAFLAGLGELVGGLLFAFGLLTPIGAILIALTMIVAIAKVHGPNGWIKPNGYEYNLLLIVVAIGVALVGPGTYAIDSFIF